MLCRNTFALPDRATVSYYRERAQPRARQRTGDMPMTTTLMPSTTDQIHNVLRLCPPTMWTEQERRAVLASVEGVLRAHLPELDKTAQR